MSESRIVATERLRREGRWDEASAYRDEVRRTLKAEKRTRAEANEGAWEAMVAKYPPLPVADPPESEKGVEDEAADFEALLDRVKDNRPDVDRDTIWVYEKLDVSSAVPDDAPSVGAWSMLKWARANRDRFFEQMLPKAMASTQKRSGAGAGGGSAVNWGEPGDPEIVDDPGLEEIEQWLQDINRRMEEDLIKDAPRTITDSVHSFLSDWRRRYDLTIPTDAAHSLACEMIGLASQCVEAALKNSGRDRQHNPAAEGA